MLRWNSVRRQCIADRRCVMLEKGRAHEDFRSWLLRFGSVRGCNARQGAAAEAARR